MQWYQCVSHAAFLRARQVQQLPMFKTLRQLPHNQVSLITLSFSLTLATHLSYHVTVLQNKVGPKPLQKADWCYPNSYAAISPALPKQTVTFPISDHCFALGLVSLTEAAW